MDEQCWMYNGKCLEEPPSGVYGFIYCITDDTGKRYWGKKAFTHKSKTKLSKKARVGTRKRFNIGTKDSKWMSYWGSCKPLLEYIKLLGNTKGFKREIIKICNDRSSLAYWEVSILIQNNVLFRDDCWNGNVCAKYFKGKIHK